MAKCKKCGRWGLFLQTNFWGVCAECVKEEEQRKAFEKQMKIRELEEERARQLLYFRQKHFPITSSVDHVQQTWKIWKKSIHDSDKQLAKQLKAIYEPIPLLIDSINLSALFTNYCTTEFYETTLTSCTCLDFKQGGYPCCHMYRLFLDLSSGVSSNPLITDISSELRTKFYALDEKYWKSFFDNIKYIGEKGHDRFLSEDLIAEIAAGLLQSSNVADYTTLLNQMTKDELFLALAKKGIQDFRPSWSKVKLISWVIDNHQDFLLKHFKQYAHISATPDVINWGQGIKQSFDSSTLIHPHFWHELCK